MKPYFSVIIVSFNASNTIEKTIQSVLAQSFTDYEIVVKDAVSTDDTLRYIPQNDKIAVYSEKDGGIYDGMNTAIKYAKGKYLIFLNCGDCFADNEVLQKVYEKARVLFKGMSKGTKGTLQAYDSVTSEKQARMKKLFEELEI